MLTRLEESLAAARVAEREARRAAERAQLHVVHCEGVVNELAGQLRAEQLKLNGCEVCDS